MRAKTTGKMIGGGILLLILLCGLSACIGSYPLSLPDILRVISGNAAGEMGEKVFFTLRLPRVLMGVTAGASLGCWEIHTPSRRPMAPDSRMACPDRRKCSRSRPRNQSQRSP